MIFAAAAWFVLLLLLLLLLLLCVCVLFFLGVGGGDFISFAISTRLKFRSRLCFSRILNKNEFTFMAFDSWQLLRRTPQCNDRRWNIWPIRTRKKTTGVWAFNLVRIISFLCLIFMQIIIIFVCKYAHFAHHLFKPARTWFLCLRIDRFDTRATHPNEINGPSKTYSPFCDLSFFPLLTLLVQNHRYRAMCFPFLYEYE